MAALGKKKKAKDDERINALDNARKQHNYHIGRLEQMLRLLDNNDLAPDQVRGFTCWGGGSLLWEIFFAYPTYLLSFVFLSFCIPCTTYAVCMANHLRCHVISCGLIWLHVVSCGFMHG